MVILNKVVKLLKKSGLSIPKSPVSLKKQDGDKLVEIVRSLQYDLDRGIIDKDVNKQVTALMRIFQISLEGLALAGSQAAIDELFIEQLNWLSKDREESFDASYVLSDYVFTPKEVEVKSSFTDDTSEVSLKKGDFLHVQFYDPEEETYKGYQKGEDGKLFGPEVEIPINKCKF